MKDDSVSTKSADQEGLKLHQTARVESGTPEEVSEPNGKATGEKAKESHGQKLRRFLLKRPKVIMAGWILVVLAFLLLAPVLYLAWYDLPLRLWRFAIEAWWHWVPAFFGFMLLFAIPIWAMMGALALTGFFADLSLSIEDTVVRDAQEVVRETEQDAIKRLEQTDAAGLLPLLKYSRAQLDAYYAIGLNQTRRSFFNAVLAMWLGFVLLLIGIVLYVGPVEKLGLTRPTADFQILILSGAAIIEFVSALFLWVYRSTTAQLTYYYKRQMYSHTSILCFRMASTMEKSDEAKRAIIDRVLDWSEKPERPPVPGAKGFRALMPTGVAKQ